MNHDEKKIRERKERKLQQRGKVIWMAGLSGAGETDIEGKTDQVTVRRLTTF